MAAGTGLVSTAVGASGPERQPKRVLELHGAKDGMGAAMQIADAIEPFDHQGQEKEEPVDQHAVGVVTLNVLHTVAVLGIVESLVPDFPAALGQFEERPRRQLGDGKVDYPFGLNDRSVLLVLPIAQDPDRGPIQRAPGIEVVGIPNFDTVLAVEERVRWRLRAEAGFDRCGEFGQVLFQPGKDGKAHLIGAVEKRGGGEFRVGPHIVGKARAEMAHRPL